MSTDWVWDSLSAAWPALMPDYPGNVVSHGPSVALVAFLTGYVGSFWLWLTVLGSWLADLVRWANDRYGYTLIARLIVEEHPCVSLVVVGSVPILLGAGVLAAF